MERFNQVAPNLFQEQSGRIYIGGQEITEQVRSILRDQAQNLMTTQLWEILYASAINEAYDIALLQSKDFDHVLSAKMLHHWTHYMKNIVIKLAKNK